MPSKPLNLLALTTLASLLMPAMASVAQFPGLPLRQSVQTRSVAQANSPVAAMEESVLAQINQYRAKRNLPPLQMNGAISTQARNHSQAMASGRVPFSHDGFQQRMKVISQTLPYSAAAENIAYNLRYTDPGKQAVQTWLQSSPHRKNIEGNFNLTGIGIAQNAKGTYYFTQIFIRSR
jgi:uncharacterized protein YkwD